jgi:hypothetical protein
MQLSTALAATALVSSVLLLSFRPRTLPLAAFVVSALELALFLGLVTFGIAGLSVPLVLGGALVLLGAVMLSRTSARTEVMAATAITLVGLIQVLTALRILS